MNAASSCKALVVTILVVLVVGEVHPAGSIPTDRSTQNAVCSTSEYRQFDFWLGDWDAFDIGGKTPVARVRVDRLLDGCVLREDYEGIDGHKGQSLSIYDSSRKVWHQSWVTNRGELLTIEGNFQSGEMILSGADRTPAGKKRQVRGMWKAEAASVRETAETSTDGGKTWQPWFDLIFKPHPSIAAADSEQDSLKS